MGRAADLGARALAATLNKHIIHLGSAMYQRTLIIPIQIIIISIQKVLAQINNYSQLIQPGTISQDQAVVEAKLTIANIQVALKIRQSQIIQARLTIK